MKNLCDCEMRTWHCEASGRHCNLIPFLTILNADLWSFVLKQLKKKKLVKIESI